MRQHQSTMPQTRQLAEFTLIEATGLAPGTFAGTIAAINPDGSLADFRSATEVGQKNQQSLKRALAPTAFVWLSLEHGTTVAVFDDLPAPGIRAQADAGLVLQRGSGVAFTTADCVPVIITSPNAALAIHAGWRGLADGIIEIALRRMLERTNAQPTDVCAWIGPAIDQKNYEIDAVVYDRLLTRPAVAAHPIGENGLIANRPGHWLADLPLIAELILLGEGLNRSQITNTGLSTFERSDLHSARRDGEKSGRMANFVALL